MAVRTVVKGERAASEEILAAQPGARLEVRWIDLADLASVAFAEGLVKDGTPVDLLINMAGSALMTCSGSAVTDPTWPTRSPSWRT